MSIFKYLVVIIFIGFTNDAFACSCAATPITEKIQEATKIIEGVAIKVELQEGVDFFSAKKTTFRIDKTYKGEVPVEFSVYSTVHSASCGVDFSVGLKYVVLVYDNDRVSSCGGQEEWYEKEYEDRMDMQGIGLLKELRKSHNQSKQ